MASPPSTPTASRPQSRAQSDVSFATEVPGSFQAQKSRSLAQEVDHIKSLVNRSQGLPRPAEGLITAQVFRNRSNSTEPVTQSRVIHELDSLKRRIRQEQQLVRRPSEADPETESEADDVLDEEDQELDNVRRTLVQEREHREELISSAEDRVDSLESTLESTRKENADLKASRDDALSSLQALQSEKDELNFTLEHLQKSLQDVQGRMERLSDDQQRSDFAVSEANEQVSKLQQLKSEVEASLAASTEKITGLEENNQIAGQHVQRLISEHKAREEESQRRLKDLQVRQDSSEKEAESSQAKISELEKGATDHEIRKRELIEQVDEHKKLLQNARKDIELHGQEISQLLKEHEKATTQVQELTKERDEQKTKYEEQLSTKDDEARKVAEDHQSMLKSIASGHEAQRRNIFDQLEEAKSLHTNELESIRTSHDRAVQDLKHSASETQRQLERTNEEARTKLAETEDKHTALQAEHSDLQDQLRQKEVSHQQHVKAAEARTAELEARSLSAERRADEAESSTKRIEELLRGEVSSKENELAEVHRQLSELHQKLNESNAELGRLNSELSTSADDKERLVGNIKSHESSLNDFKRKYDSDLEELKAAQAAEIDRIRGEAEQAAEKAEKGHADALEEVQANHRNAMDGAQRDRDAVIEQTRNQHVEELERLTVAHQTTLREAETNLTKRHDEDMQRRQAEETDRQAELASKHQEELQQLREGAEKVNEDQEAAIAEISAKHQSAERELTELKARHASEIFALKADHEQFAGSTTEEHKEAVSALRSDLSKAEQAMQEVSKSSAEEIDRLRAEHEQRVRELEAGWSSKTTEAAKSHEADLQRAADAASHEAARARDDFQRQLDEDKASADARHASLSEEHAAELAKIKDGFQSQLNDSYKAIEAGKNNLEAVKAQFEKMLEDRHVAHDEDVGRIRDLETSQTERQSVLANLEETIAALKEDMSSASTAHSKVLEELGQAQNALNVSKVEMQQSHENSLRNALDKAHGEHEEQITENRRIFDERSADLTKATNEKLASRDSLHREEMRKRDAEMESLKNDKESELSRLRHELDHRMRERIAKLEQQHENALTAALANADDELEERLKTQSKAHSMQLDKLQENLHGELESLQLQLEQANELRQTQMQESETTNQRSLAELGSKLEAAEQTSVALQARLDMELSTRGETERSLAEVRKQRFEEEKRTGESKAVLQKQLEALQAERDALLKEKEALSASRDIHEPETSEPLEHSENTENVTVLKKRLSMAEKGREDAHLTVQQELDRKSELARQNEFLAKELETLMANRSVPVKPVTNRTDAFAQTDSVIVMSEADYAHGIREQKSDAALSAATKQQRQAPPTVPVSKPQQNDVNGVTDRAWKTRSFEDYLQRAKAELSELGSVISANEALFAQKIQEHVGDLQRAKDQLAAEYKDKFDALFDDKEKMERDVSVQHAADFAEERQQLVASYGADHDEPAKQAAALSNLPTTQRKALRNAEERLVSEYNQKVAKRKSQIALKHAEDYQNLTQDFDRRLAELLGNREKLESDLSVEPSKFEQDLDQIEVMSARLESEKANSTPNSPQATRSNKEAVGDEQSSRTGSPAMASKDNGPVSQLPKKSLTSTPRTQTSIPRAVPFPGNREGMSRGSAYQSSQRQADTRRTVSERHPPIRQQALLRSKSPPIVSGSKAAPQNNQASERSPMPMAKSKFSIDPSEVDNKASPPDQARILPQAIRTQKNRSSLRHSSRIIYGDWHMNNDS